MKLLVPEDKLIVRVEKEEVVAASGIIISSGTETEEHPHDTVRAVVLHVGHMVPFIPVGKKTQKAVKVGDFILYEHCHSRPVEIDGEDCKMVKYSEIIGVIL